MIKFKNNILQKLNKNDVESSVAHTYDLIDKINLIPSARYVAFPENFLDHTLYLIFPKFFQKIYNINNKIFTNDICTSGYFYFKYLLCLDSLTDQDNIFEKESDKYKLNKMQVLQSHIYHEQALIILGKVFGKKHDFWKKWGERNNEFLKSIQFDSSYNISMNLEDYEQLCIGKCSFTNVAVDVFHFYKDRNTNIDIYNNLIEINNFFSIARCIQDDIEDFKKDLIFKKNNLGHVFLNNWLKDKNLEFDNFNNEELEKLFISSGQLEKLLSLSMNYYERAIEICNKYDDKLKKYKTILLTLCNSMLFYKVQVQSYRIDVLIKNKIGSTERVQNNNIRNSIEMADSYIKKLQFNDGNWYENLNKQGLSNIWATAFISMFLDESRQKEKAMNFLKKINKDNLWGYNTDWIYDYDSTTCVLLNIIDSEEKKSISKNWTNGQNKDGGFSTYSEKDTTRLYNLLNLDFNKNIKGWTQSHICVSALAYYFIVSKDMKNDIDFSKLKEYIHSNLNSDNIWDSYWWTSPIYASCIILQAMIIENENSNLELVESKLMKIFELQLENGAFICPLNKNESAFYSSLVLDTVCLNKKIYDKFSKEADKICTWLLNNQFENGSFSNTEFQIIPNPNVIKWNTKKTFFKNKFGGTNTVTGEEYGLFSTSIALRAFKRFLKMSN